MGGINNKKFRFWQVELGLGLGEWIYTKAPTIARWLIIEGHLLTHCSHTTVGEQLILTSIALLVVFWGLPASLLIVPVCIMLAVICLGYLFPHTWFKWVYHFPYVLNAYQLLGQDLYGGDPLPLQVQESMM